MERDLILEFHIARQRHLAALVVSVIEDHRPGGLFEGRARCRTLWDEACWALQESQDEEAIEAAESTIRQFCSDVVSVMLVEEIRLHCYNLSDDNADDGKPFVDTDAVTEDLTQEVAYLACQRNLSELES